MDKLIELKRTISFDQARATTRRQQKRSGLCHHTDMSKHMRSEFGGGGGGGRPEQQQQQQEKQKQQYAGVQGAQKSAPNGAPVTAQPGGNTFGGLGAFGFARSYGLWTVVTCCLVGMIAAAVSLQRIRPRRGRSVQAGDREDSSLFEFLFRTTPEDTL
mmetsp:Transcript_23088/g.49144  ORF Transcript_23088/g.49144 Transcript_23088/m.49144 type:complete len:158 (-) Transcript_23088:307-780(-)